MEASVRINLRVECALELETEPNAHNNDRRRIIHIISTIVVFRLCAYGTFRKRGAQITHDSPCGWIPVSIDQHHGQQEHKHRLI